MTETTEFRAAEAGATLPEERKESSVPRNGMLSLCDPSLSNLTCSEARGTIRAIRERNGERFITAIADHVAAEVRTAISSAASLKEIKRSVTTVLQSHGCPEVDARTFNWWTREAFESVSPEGWRERYIGHLRRALIPAEDVDLFLQRAMEHRRSALRGTEGYRRAASLLFGGNMLKAYMRMSALCGAAGVEMKELQWGNQFNGTAQEFREGIAKGKIGG